MARRRRVESGAGAGARGDGSAAARVTQPRVAARGAMALAATLLLAGCASLPQPPADLPADFVPDASSSTAADASPDLVGGFTALEREALRVRVRTCESYGTGSAFAIDDTHAITNRHVAQGATDITLTGYDGARYSVKSSVLSPDYDLALLTVDGTLPNVANLADAAPSPGDVLTIAGYPLGEALAVRQGPYVDDVKDEIGGAPDLVYRIDAETHPGNSGSPLANEDGDVVGVVYASDDVHTTYAVALETLETFLANLDDAEKNTADCAAQN